MLQIYNTLFGRKEEVRPRVPGVITLYVCGITPYDYSHMGHARVYVTFDVLYRLLNMYGYEVRYCRNFTDIDDKIIKKAEDQFGNGQQYQLITQHYIRAFHEDMDALHCARPTVEPRVTDHIPAIITFIQQLVEAGYAYEVDGDVYFSIPSFPPYGTLSKRNIEDMYAGARVEVNDKKRYPLDFALWKREPEGSFWSSPWGYGRPGWHIECSVLAAQYLGESIDIHAGGLDLMFPHHENEIAQSESRFGKPLANYWMHNGFVQINHEKMSKSLGNFFTLRQVFQKFHPDIVRFYLLSHHYRAPLEFSFDDLATVQKAYNRLCRAFESVESTHTVSTQGMMRSGMVQRLLQYINDDLNIQGAFGVLFDELHSVATSDQAGAVKAFMHRALGLPLQAVEHQAVITPEIAALIEQRAQARAAKDWTRADQLRDQLVALGVELHDKKS